MNPEPKPVPEVVVKAIRDGFPNKAEHILREMKWSPLSGCWFIELYGITIGIEVDGYIHS